MSQNSADLGIPSRVGVNALWYYADEITDARFKGGDPGVLSKALSDLQAAGRNISEQDVAAKMREFTIEAAEQL
jgi:hypothetical protein